MESQKVVEGTESVTKEQEVKSVVKYTDDDMNNIIKKKEIKHDENIAKTLGTETVEEAAKIVAEYNKIKEAQKTEGEKRDEELLAVKDKLSSKDQRIFELESKMKANELGIDTDFLEDAIILAKAKTTEDKDFDTALTEIAERFSTKKEKGKFGLETNPTKEKIEKKPQKMW